MSVDFNDKILKKLIEYFMHKSITQYQITDEYTNEIRILVIIKP